MKIGKTTQRILKNARNGVAGILGDSVNPERRRQDKFHPDASAQLLLKEAMQARASDLHLDSEPEQLRIRLRIDGILHDVLRMPIRQGNRLIRYFKTLGNLQPVATFNAEDARARITVDNEPLDLRLACAPGKHGEKVSMRLLRPNFLEYPLEKLGFSSEDLGRVSAFLENINGMCLVTGPTGVGKTTTLYALLRNLDLQHRSLITLEDPVESMLEGVTQIQVDEMHGLTFAEGIKVMLRLDPDYLLLGEIRDKASVKAAFRASVSGRVLFSSMHSRDTAGVLSVLRNWDAEDHQLATVLEMVIAQRLVRRLCNHCKKSTPPTADQKHWLKSFGLPVPAKAASAKGCKHCRNTGYAGRIGIFEVWRKDREDEELIHAHATESQFRDHFRQRGNPSLLDDAMSKVEQGITSIAEMRRMGAQFSFIRKGGQARPKRRSSARKKNAPRKKRAAPVRSSGT